MINTGNIVLCFGPRIEQSWPNVNNNAGGIWYPKTTCPKTIFIYLFVLFFSFLNSKLRYWHIFVLSIIENISKKVRRKKSMRKEEE